MFSCQAISLGILRSRKAVRALKLAAGPFAWAATAFALMTYHEGNQDTVAIKPIGNQTIVLRQEKQTNTLEQTKVFEHHESDAQAIPPNYARVVQTVGFFKPDASQNVGMERELHALNSADLCPDRQSHISRRRDCVLVRARLPWPADCERRTV